jgi:hypothetical protein
MSPESQKTIFMLLGFVLLGVIIGVALKMLLGCKSGEIKVDGKCYKLVEQDTPTAANGIDEPKIRDKNLSTGVTTVGATNTSYKLKVKDATKIVKGARVTAKADGTSETEQVELKLKSGTSELTFKFPKNGKVKSVGMLFNPALASAVPEWTLEVPPGVTVHEVELI